jgi:anthranilate synthase/aminodeoxychorismate synthase-like glutamine amidotransferase
MARVLVIDSYDSFVYNIVQYLGELGAEPIVVRNDQLTVDEAVALQPDGVLLSPGPGRPEEAGIICDAIRAFAGNTPVFGVCLGHQAIGHVYGGDVVRAPQLMHGKTSFITHTNTGVFEGLANPLEATRYHSLVIEKSTIPAELLITAETGDGIVMGVRHRDVDVEGVQFHPESLLTAAGHDLLRNFLNRCAYLRGGLAGGGGGGVAAHSENNLCSWCHHRAHGSALANHFANVHVACCKICVINRCTKT